MNVKAQTGSFFTLMIAIVMFIIGFNLGSALVTNNSAVMTSLGCSSSPATWLHITCTVVDIIAPFFMAILLGLSGLIIGAKVIF